MLFFSSFRAVIECTVRWAEVCRLSVRTETVSSLSRRLWPLRQNNLAYLSDLLYQPVTTLRSSSAHLIFYTSRSFLPHLLHVPSPLQLQLFGTNCALDTTIASAPLYLVSKLNFISRPTLRLLSFALCLYGI